MDTTSAEFLNQVDSASAFFKEQRRVSVAEFQRKYQIGFARAVAICDELVNRGELIHLKNGFHFNLPASDINRFVLAQDGPVGSYEQALAEIKKGTNTSDWIWYIFPQFRIFGHSETSLYYGISDSREAECYLAHPILGVRIREISKMLLKNKRKPSVQIFGDHGAKKVHSCMTMFDFLSPNDVFARVLEAFYKGEREAKTLKELATDQY